MSPCCHATSASPSRNRWLRRRVSHWPHSSVRVIRCSTRSSTSRSSVTAISCAEAPCWSTSAIRASVRACCSILSTPFRMPDLPARVSAASSPSACSMSRSTPTATRDICTTRPISTTGRSPRTSPALRRSCRDPNAAWIGRELEQKAQGYAIAHVVPEHLAEVRARKLELIDKTEAAVKDRLTKEISLLGSPCRAAEAAGAGRQAQCPAQLGRGPQARRCSAGAPGKAPGGAEAGAPDLAAAAGGARRAAGGAGGLDRSHGRAAAPASTASPDTQAAAARARADRHGDRARPRLRADRPRVREARLRHREPRARHRASCASSR